MSKRRNTADFIGWDVCNWSCALDFWTAHTRHDLSNSLALELGSGQGGLSLWLALQGARVLCSNVSPPNSAVLEKHAAYGVSHLIQYASIDATNIPYTDEFDIIVFKSILGAVGYYEGKPAQAKAIREMHKALKPNGELFFAENLTASWLHQTLRRKFLQWGAAWRYVTVAEMQEFLSPFSSMQYRTLGVTGTLGRGETQRNILGMLDQAILNHMAPENWRYIIAGVARK